MQGSSNVLILLNRNQQTTVRCRFRASGVLADDLGPSIVFHVGRENSLIASDEKPLINTPGIHPHWPTYTF